MRPIQRVLQPCKTYAFLRLVKNLTDHLGVTVHNSHLCNVRIETRFDIRALNLFL